MKVKIEDIVVNERIRKEFGDVSDLARDIDENGLINPITITKDNVLIAGERRLEACKLLGFDEVEVHILEIGDETHFLMAEISENEQRKEFTFSEKMRWAERLKRLRKSDQNRKSIFQETNGFFQKPILIIGNSTLFKDLVQWVISAILIK